MSVSGSTSWLQKWETCVLPKLAELLEKLANLQRRLVHPELVGLVRVSPNGANCTSCVHFWAHIQRMWRVLDLWGVLIPTGGVLQLACLETVSRAPAVLAAVGQVNPIIGIFE